MDTQRLILFFVFGFSLLMLWDAWEKEHRPKPAQLVQASPAATVPTPAGKAGVPPSAAQAAAPAPSSNVPGAAAPAPTGETDEVPTDH